MVAASALRAARLLPRCSRFSSRRIPLQRAGRFLGMGMLGAALTMHHVTIAYCAGAGTEPEENSPESKDKKKIAEECNSKTEDEAAIEGILSLMGPFLGQVSYGSLLGGSAGYAAKKMTKAAACAIGATFLFLQFLAYKGYIFIEWRKVEEDVVKALDQDGDGDFDGDDVKLIVENMWDFIKFQLPSASGFGLGFVAGFKYG